MGSKTAQSDALISDGHAFHKIRKAWTRPRQIRVKTPRLRRHRVAMGVLRTAFRELADLNGGLSEVASAGIIWFHQ